MILAGEVVAQRLQAAGGERRDPAVAAKGVVGCMLHGCPVLVGALVPRGMPAALRWMVARDAGCVACAGALGVLDARRR